MGTETLKIKTGIPGKKGYLYGGYHYFHLRDTAGQELDFHYHDFDKIVILLAGHVDYLVENDSYPLQPGSILLVCRHAIHKAIIDKSCPYDRIIIYLNRDWLRETMPKSSLRDCFVHADPRGSALILPEEASLSELRNILLSFEKASEDSRPVFSTMRDTYILQFLILLNGLSAASPAPVHPAPSLDPKISEAVSYIENNLDADLSVDTLAARVYLSRYHFMRLFSAQMGDTVHSFVREKRLLNAARLIREGCPAGAAAEKSGFNDYSTFCRAFRSCFGIKPSDIT